MGGPVFPGPHLLLSPSSRLVAPSAVSGRVLADECLLQTWRLPASGNVPRASQMASAPHYKPPCLLEAISQNFQFRVVKSEKQPKSSPGVLTTHRAPGGLPLSDLPGASRMLLMRLPV